MHINTLSMAHPLEWLKMGWSIFINNPLQWILILIVFFIISIICNLIPLVGSLIFMLTSPALMAGIFLATQKSANGEVIEVKDLFSVVTDPNQRMPFIFLGVVVLIVNLLIMMIILLPMMGAVGLGYLSSDNGQMMSSMAAGAGIGSLLLIIPLTIVYLMAMIYAIPLMLFSNQGIKQALLLSLKASASNILPMLLLSLIYFVLAIIAMIPMGLGFLILFPVTFGIVYASYKDIFS